MLALLSPISLWLGAALAVPLAIHFLGRQRLKRQPFPSLLLVAERFSKSMHRHRLKNFLLLLLRTMLILCLLLALASPALRSNQATASHPENSLALVHNGIYGNLPFRDGKNTLEAQRQRLRTLDSSEGIHTQVIPLIEDGPGVWDVSERFGDYSEALSRMLTAIASRPGTTQFHIPVFAWADLSPAKEALLRALKENPGLQIALTDYGDAGSKVLAFTETMATPATDAPAVNLVAQINPSAAVGKVQVFLNGRRFQELSPDAGHVEVTLPLGEGPRTIGKLSLQSSGMGTQDYHFCFPDAGEWVMVHVGTAMSSLPSLGRETYFRRIIHVAGTKDIPWSGTANPKSTRTGNSGLKLVYLANERSIDPAAYARVVGFVKQGGRLIIGVGQESDIPMINRFLLQPLRLGRLGNVIEAASNASISIHRTALAGLGKVPKDLGSLGNVRKRFVFLPDLGTDILLSQSGDAGTTEGKDATQGVGTTQGVVLASRDFHRGKVLLWTTDIDDLNWSDIGVSPITPLLHQALQETGSEDRARNLSVASDSILTMTLEDNSAAALVPSNSETIHPEIRDPQGRAFTRMRLDGRRLHVGPFDRLGLYQIFTGSDSIVFAVNLAGVSERGGGNSGKAGLEDWEQENKDAKEAILKEFKPYQNRFTVLSKDQPAVAQAAVWALWPTLFLVSILLLFLEGLIASAFSLRRSRI